MDQADIVYRPAVAGGSPPETTAVFPVPLTELEQVRVGVFELRDVVERATMEADAMKSPATRCTGYTRQDCDGCPCRFMEGHTQQKPTPWLFCEGRFIQFVDARIPRRKRPVWPNQFEADLYRGLWDAIMNIWSEAGREWKSVGKEPLERYWANTALCYLRDVGHQRCRKENGGQMP